ncbi:MULTISPECIES: hypothetical protein [unclassified Streptomyces]|uniref:hypothetical protein n=1 Tax=Streptomycetaceae TaxID=2062 RepID=UPI002E76500A|nr:MULTISPECIES: hypothetical protein [unclassified Streptomyces]MED7951879.1 hypothetical protein [Streptomyces sp. BE303]MEE1823731.1 hypothetical protein [Streptomyces sp. BE20]
MRKIAMAMTALSLAVGTGIAAAPGAVAATTCPSGAVCIREFGGDILSKNIFYSYGAHNLDNVTGYHILANSQTGGAGFELCRGYNGTDCSITYRTTGDYPSIDFTPINSILLVP